MPLTFSQDRLRFIRQRPRQIHAALVIGSENYEPGRIYTPFREFTAHDSDGNSLGRQRQPIYNTEQGDRAKVTVRACEKIDTRAGKNRPAVLGRELTVADAQGCGYRTVLALRDAWKAQHRTHDAHLVWFIWGDQRDIDTFMQRTGLAGGDYTRNRSRALDPDAPVLTRDQMDRLVATNRQKDVARSARAAQDLARKPLADRWLTIEERGERLRLSIAREIRVATARLDRAELRESRRSDLAA